MTPNEYQELAARTMNKDLTHDQALSMLSMGLSGEAGEVTDYLKKVVYHSHPYSGEVLSKELGDVLWYLAVLAHVNGISLDTIMERNIEKLKKRYPDGFSSEDSLKRVDTTAEALARKNGVPPSVYAGLGREIDKDIQDIKELTERIDKISQLPYVEMQTKSSFIRMQTKSSFIRRLWYFVSNPVRYLVWGNLKW